MVTVGIGFNVKVHTIAKIPVEDLQRFHTANVMNHMEKYMPFRTGATIKTMFGQTDVSGKKILLDTPYVWYLYHGKRMVNAKTGKGPHYIENVGFRYPRGATLRATNEPLNYTTTKNPMAGPYWDRRTRAAEMPQIVAELQKHADRRMGMK